MGVVNAKSLQQALEPVLAEHGVDMYFCGHKHSYERHYPVFDSIPDLSSAPSTDVYAAPSNTVHILTGNGGNDEGHSDYSKVVDNRPAWNVLTDTTTYGYGVLSVKSASELVWTQ